MQGATGTRKKQRMTLELRPLSRTLDESDYLVEPVGHDVEAHRAQNRTAVPVPVVPAPAVLLQMAVAVPVPPCFLLRVCRVAVPVHVDDVYLVHVRLLRVAKARETPEQINVKLQSSYEYP